MLNRAVLFVCTFSAAFTDFISKGDRADYVYFKDREYSDYYYSEDKATYISVDLRYGETATNYFPKCCPPGYSYETYNRRCVKDVGRAAEFFNNLNVTVNLVRTSMEDCEVIIDYDHVEFDDIKFDNDSGIVFKDLHFSFGRYCVDSNYLRGDYVVRVCRTVAYCTSNNHNIYGETCVKKCCPDGKMFVNKVCTKDPTYGVNLTDYNHLIRYSNHLQNVAIYTGGGCKRKYLLNYDDLSNFYITPNGSIFEDKPDGIFEYKINQPSYCVDAMRGNTTNAKLVFLFCIDDDSEYSYKIELSRIVLSISSFCLLLTIIIYFASSKFRTLIGKVIICYSASMLMAFLSLTFVQFMPNLDEWCKINAYMILFGFHATFAWLNVMCFEIWKTFGLLKSSIPHERQKRIFIKYNLYAWLIPTIAVLLVMMFNFYRVLPDTFHPFIGEAYCILENRITDQKYGHALFVAFPQAMMLLINTILFIDTTRHYLKSKKEAANLQNPETNHATRRKLKIQRHDAARFLMVLKLFLIMGLLWIFEVVSSIYNFKKRPTLAVIETVIDTINCLQGVFVFIIFVLNRKTILKIVKKCGLKRKRQEESNDSDCNSISASNAERAVEMN